MSAAAAKTLIFIARLRVRPVIAKRRMFQL
jgi:hypothetical protein